MSNQWLVTLEGSLPIKADDLHFVFKDISRVCAHSIKPIFFQDLINRIDSYSQYHTGEQIKSIVNNEGDIIPAQNCSAVLSTEKKSKQQRGVVFLKLEDNNFFPIGVWPNKFADDVIANPRVLLEYIEKIVQQPEKFDDVRYLIPVKLGEISDEPPKQVLWSVTLEGKTPETEDDWVLEFVDLKQFRKLKQLTTRYFQDLRKTIDLNIHYKVMRQIKQITSNMNENLQISSSIVISIFGKDETLFFNLLLHLVDKESYEIIGVWPPTFAETLLKNEALFNSLLIDTVQTPELFKEVLLLLPIEKGIIKGEPITFWKPIYKEGVTSLLPQNGGSFVDCHELTADIFVLSHFFADLRKNTETYDHYQWDDRIFEFRSQTDSILSHDQFAFVVSTKTDNSNHGLLFQKENGKYSLQGIWPESFFQAYQKNDRVLFELIDSLIKAPSTFKSVKFYVAA